MDAAGAKGLDFFLLHPATIKVRDGVQYKVFTSPKEAEDVLPSVPAPSPEVPAEPDGASPV